MLRSSEFSQTDYPTMSMWLALAFQTPSHPRPRTSSRANSTRYPQKQFLRQSPRLKPNPPLALPLLSRVLRLRLPHLPDLPLHKLLRHLPPPRIIIRAPRMNRIHADVENVSIIKTLCMPCLVAKKRPPHGARIFFRATCRRVDSMKNPFSFMPRGRREYRAAREEPLCVSAVQPSFRPSMIQ